MHAQDSDHRGVDFIESASRIALPFYREVYLALGRVHGVEEAERVPAAQ